MLTVEENERLTKVGPGTPMGELMRRYWQPIAGIAELYAAVEEGVPPAHGGSWGKANLEVCLAVLQSARERREVFLSHQVPTRD